MVSPEQECTYLAYPSAAASKDFEEPVGDKIPVFENMTLCTGWAITFPPIKFDITKSELSYSTSIIRTAPMINAWSISPSLIADIAMCIAVAEDEHANRFEWCVIR